MALIRIVVDIEVPDRLTRGEVQGYANSLKDYAAVVLGPQVTGKPTNELNMEHNYHVHLGNGCRSCMQLAEDGKA